MNDTNDTNDANDTNDTNDGNDCNSDWLVVGVLYPVNPICHIMTGIDL